jgi:hypothetical protein
VERVVLESLDLPEAWASAQCCKVLTASKWSEFVLQNSKKNNNFRREDANIIYENVGRQYFIPGTNSTQDSHRVGREYLN